MEPKLPRVRAILVRLVNTISARRDDIDEELRAHVQLHIDDNLRAGMTQDEARRRALIALGGMAQTKERWHDGRRLAWLEDLSGDLRFSLRTMRRAPIFTAVIVLSLAIGIGANTALFSLVEATVLRELPVDGPDELVYLQWQSRGWGPDAGRFGGSGSVSSVRRSPSFSNASFEALQKQNATLAELFAFSHATNVTAAVTGRDAVAATMQFVSGNYFSALRVAAAAGRALTAADDLASAAPAVVISDLFWQRHFARQLWAIGAPIFLDGKPFTIVGVAPRAFRGAAGLGDKRPDLWLPVKSAAAFESRRAEHGFWWLWILGRLRAGVTPAQVRGNLEGAFLAAARSTETVPADDVPALHVLSARRGASDVGSPEDDVEHLIILGAAFAVLLLIVCLNVANLLLSRSAARRTEIAVRLALGAGGGRLVRQLLTESLVLAAAGGLLGVVLASWGRALFAASRLVPADLELGLSPAVIIMTGVLSASTGVLFGLGPAFRATRIGAVGRVERLDLTPPVRRPVDLLLVAQVVVAVVLLIGAGLFVRTLGNWRRINTGFDVQQLLVFHVNPEALGYDAASAAQFRDEFVRQIRQLPGVTAATSSGPFWEGNWYARSYIDGETQRRRGEDEWGHGTTARLQPVRHDFFSTLGVQLVEGRTFPADADQRPATTAIVDQRYVQVVLRGAPAIGRRIAFAANGREVAIIGVVKDIRLPGGEFSATPTIYLPERTRPGDLVPRTRPAPDARNTFVSSFVVRTRVAPTTVLKAIRAMAGSRDARLSIEDAKTIEQGFAEVLAPTRIVMLIWLTFGGVALALTVIGLYGLLAAGVAQRTREIGLRTALGASSSDIVRLVTGRAIGLVTAGLFIGIAASMGVNQVARAYLYGVTFYDPLTLLGVIAVLWIAAAAAAFIPTRAALRLEPSVALRCE